MTICVDANSSQMMNERNDPSMKKKKNQSLCTAKKFEILFRKRVC